MLLHTTFVSLWDGGWGVQAPASQTDYRLWFALSGGSERSLAKLPNVNNTSQFLVQSQSWWLRGETQWPNAKKTEPSSFYHKAIYTPPVATSVRSVNDMPQLLWTREGKTNAFKMAPLTANTGIHTPKYSYVSVDVVRQTGWAAWSKDILDLRICMSSDNIRLLPNLQVTF